MPEIAGMMTAMSTEDLHVRNRAGRYSALIGVRCHCSSQALAVVLNVKEIELLGEKLGTEPTPIGRSVPEGPAGPLDQLTIDIST